MAVVPIITELGLRGVRIDPNMWAPLAENAERAHATARVNLDRIAGSTDVNWASWQQIQKLLAERGIFVGSTDEAHLR